jgi:hypothetical protein
MCVKVVAELALGHLDIIYELLHLRVAGLRVGKNLAHEIDRSLDLK